MMCVARRASWRMAPKVLKVLGVGLDDVRQEAYLAACEAVTTADGARDVEAYVATAVINHFRILMRTAKQPRRRGASSAASIERLGREKKELLTCELLPQASPGTNQLAHLLACNLSGRQRAIVEMSLRGQNNCEIARELGINEATVRIYYSRAVRRLQKDDGNLVRRRHVLCP